MQLIRVFEHESLTTTEDDFGRMLKDHQLEMLCRFNDKNQQKYFMLIRNGIKFSQYVGVIQIGNLTIEILPKADKMVVMDENFTELTYKWQRVLLKMLALCGELALETVSEANLRRRFTLLDLYFEMYLSELDALLRKGLVKHYRHVAGNVKALKGRMKFSRDIQQNLIHRERFYTIHQEYDHQHLLNQILLKGLTILSTVTTKSLLRNKVRKLLFLFPEISGREITGEEVSRIRLTLAIAKMLILNYSPDITKGNENMLALMFDMNVLWENYIYKKLRLKENVNLSVTRHERKDFWETKSICPDIVLRTKEFDQSASETFVIDTKWKIIEPSNPSAADLKQMYVYNMYWQSTKSMLLYPKSNSSGDTNFGRFHQGREGDNLCKPGFVDEHRAVE